MAQTRPTTPKIIAATKLAFQRSIYNGYTSNYRARYVLLPLPTEA